MGTQPVASLANLPPGPLRAQIVLAVTRDNEHPGLTELITRLALLGPFHLIAGSEWLPDQDSLRRAVRRHTAAVDEALGHPNLGRPATCLQLRDQLEQASLQDYPVLVLDFLHYFYDPNVDVSLRKRVLEQCCMALSRLSQSRPVLVLVRHLPMEEYEQFFPSIASIAREIFEAGQNSPPPASQPALFERG